MRHRRSLDKFIICWARKMAAIYPNSCTSEEDYIQEGYLKLAEIRKDRWQKRNFHTYATAVIARSIRDAAIKATFPLSAPLKVKTLAVKVRRRLEIGQSEKTIRQQLKITANMWKAIHQLIKPTASLLMLQESLYIDPGTSLALDDILALPQLTIEDKALILAQYDDNVGALGLSRKQSWTRIRRIRKKLNRSGYGDSA